MPKGNDKYTQNFSLKHKRKSPIYTVLNRNPQLPLTLNPHTHSHCIMPNFGDRWRTGVFNTIWALAPIFRPRCQCSTCSEHKGCQCVNWFQLAQVRFQFQCPINTIMKQEELQKTLELLTRRGTISLSYRRLPHDCWHKIYSLIDWRIDVNAILFNPLKPSGQLSILPSLTIKK